MKMLNLRRIKIVNISENKDLVNNSELIVCLFVLEFYGPVNEEVMSSWSVNSDTVPGQA